MATLHYARGQETESWEVAQIVPGSESKDLKEFGTSKAILKGKRIRIAVKGKISRPESLAAKFWIDDGSETFAISDIEEFGGTADHGHTLYDAVIAG